MLTVEMMESMKRESIIQGDLNDLIERWTFALKDYRHLEEEYILSGALDVIDAIRKLRNDPELFLSSNNIKLKELAIKRCHIFTIMKKLKISIPKLSTKYQQVDKSLPVDPVFNSFNHVDNEMMQQSTNPSVNTQTNNDISSLVSNRWASRLGNIYTRDNESKVENTTNDTIEKVPNRELKLKWPDFLPDVSYDVLKTSLFEQSVRTLKLTEYHILDIKESNRICDIFLLTEIKRIWLRNADTLVLTLKTNKEIFYSSPIASHVIQQITSRVKIRIALEKGFSINTGSNGDNSFQGIEYSASSTAKIISEISQTNLAECDNTIKAFANDLGVKTKQLRKKSIISMPTGNTEDIQPSDTTKVADTTSSSIKAFTLQAFTINSSEYKVQRKLQDILCNPSSPEGRTKDDFVANFTYRNRKLKDVRNFIDSMNDHIIIHRGNCLAFILRNNYEEESGVNLIENLNESELAVLSYIIFTTIEESVFLPLKDKILALCRELNDDTTIVSKTNALSDRNQIDWGIEEKYVSPLGWQNAIFELSNLEINLSPSTQMTALTRAAKAIYSEFKLAVIPRLKTQKQKVPEYLGADDFVPIFIYVVSKSNLKHPALNKDIMWNLCHPEILRGEIGYFLTVYESAIEFIASEPVDTNINTTRFSELANKSRLSATSVNSSASTSSMMSLRRISQFIASPMVRNLSNQSTDISLRESFTHL